MEKYILKVFVRDLNIDLETLRAEGKLPVEVYGHSFENVHGYVMQNEFEKVYAKAGNSSIVELEMENGEKVPSIVQDTQVNRLQDFFVHVDFFKLNMKEKVKAEVELKFVGESPAVKNLSGVLVTPLQSVEISCLPTDLMQDIEVDLAGLEDFDSAIHVKDLVLPEGVEITNDSELVVALVEEPKAEEEPVVGETPEGEEGEDGQATDNSSQDKEENKDEK